MLLGSYLGTSIDGGTVLTENIIKLNENVVHRSTLRGLTLKEIDSESEKEQCKEFDQLVSIKLGVEEYETDFEKLGIEENTTFEPYADNDKDSQLNELTPDELAPETEEWDNYVNTDVMLQSGEKMDCGTVVRQKQYVDKNW